MTRTDQTPPATAHTPEPWWLDDEGFIAAGSDDTYCTVADPHCRPTADYGEENEANACRIVAAVNACTGLSTEALEQGVVAKLLAALEKTTPLLDACARNAERLRQREFAAQLLTIMTADRYVIADAEGTGNPFAWRHYPQNQS